MPTAIRVQRLGPGAPAPAVLRALGRRARHLGLAPPAALIGSWFGSRAILAPSVEVRPCEVRSALVAGQRGHAPGGAVGGGWFGQLAYPDGSTSAPASGGWSDSVLRLDPTGCWWFESLTGQACPAELAEAVRVGAAPLHWEMSWTAPDGDAHRSAVRKCLAAIAEGEIYQACVCTRFTGSLRGEPAELFATGVEVSSPARGAYLEGAWGAVVSFSPELFLARHGKHVRSSPIKGTLPLSADPALLRASAKEVAENVMIVDLVRNDLGRVCEIGSVTVSELLTVRAAPGVWHLVSTVRGVVPAHVTDAQLVDAAFPPGSVTGAPKSRARELIACWERSPRGAYCGAVGMASPVAGFELNVAIRTVEIDAVGEVALGVGGGITIDSDPEAEWQECLTKAAAVLNLSSGARVHACVS